MSDTPPEEPEVQSPEPERVLSELRRIAGRLDSLEARSTSSARVSAAGPLRLGILDFLLIIVSLAGVLMGMGSLAGTLITPRLDDIKDGISQLEQSVGEDINEVNARLVSIESDLREMNRGLGEVKGRLGIPSEPEPEASSDTLWTAVNSSDSPYSVLQDNGVWSGVWPNVAREIAAELGLKDYRFVSPDATLNYRPLFYGGGKFNYLLGFLPETSSTAERLVNQGWTEVALDPYLAQSGCPSLGYSLLVPPEMVEAMYAEEIVGALDRLPMDLWNDLARQIDSCHAP